LDYETTSSEYEFLGNENNDNRSAVLDIGMFVDNIMMESEEVEAEAE
jgi:hypothetical protein